MKKTLHSVDEFLRAIPSMPQFHKITKGQLMGFRSLMKSEGKLYTLDLHKYIPLLSKFINE